MITVRRFALGAALLSLLLTTAAASPVAPTTSPAPTAPAARVLSKADLEPFVDGVVAAQFRDNHLAGAVITVVHDGQMVLSKGYGYADIAAGVRANPETSEIRPGSVSKLLTWTAVMQLVAEGRLDLDADLNRYLKSFRIPASGYGPITMRHLMTHSAGFDAVPYRTLVKLSPDEFEPLGQALRDNMPARIRPPGAVSAYSNYGTALAGFVVQEITGVPFETYVDQKLLRPLGMTHSSFVEPLPGKLPATTSQGYYYSQGKLAQAPFEYIHNFSPAGSMTTTAGDMGRFMLAHLQGGSLDGQTILPAAETELMHRRAFGHDPAVPGMALGFYEMSASGRRLLTHKGRTAFHMSQLALLPEENFGIFVSFNSAEGSPPAEAVIRAVVARYFADGAAPAALPAKLPDGAWQGAYRSDWTVERGFDKVMALGKDMKVTAGPDGAVVAMEGTSAKRYEPRAARGLWSADAEEPLVIKRSAADGRLWLYWGNPVVAAYQLRWYETGGLHLLILGGSMLVFLAGLAASVRALARRDEGRLPWIPVSLLAAALTLEIAFALGMGAVLMGPAKAMLAWRLPPYLPFVLTLPLLALAAAVASAVAAATTGGRKALRRPSYLFCLATIALFSWSLHFWNLLGPG